MKQLTTVTYQTAHSGVLTRKVGGDGGSVKEITCNDLFVFITYTTDDSKRIIPMSRVYEMTA